MDRFPIKPVRYTGTRSASLTALVGNVNPACRPPPPRLFHRGLRPAACRRERDQRRLRLLAGTCQCHVCPTGRPRACLAMAWLCLLAWSPDLQAARHERGSSQPDRDTTPARARSVAAHAPWALAGRANWTSTVVGCLRPAGRRAKPGRSIQSLSPVLLFLLLVVIPTRKKNNTSSRRVTRRYQYATKTTPAGNVRTLSEPRTRSRLPLLPRKHRSHQCKMESGPSAMQCSCGKSQSTHCSLTGRKRRSRSVWIGSSEHHRTHWTPWLRRQVRIELAAQASVRSL